MKPGGGHAIMYVLKRQVAVKSLGLLVILAKVYNTTHKHCPTIPKQKENLPSA